MLPVLGFSVPQAIAVRQTIVNAGKALARCQACCQPDNGTFQRYFEEWFSEPGAANGPSVELLIRNVDQMAERLHNSGNSLVVTFCDDRAIMGIDHGNVDSAKTKVEKGPRPAYNVKNDIDTFYRQGKIAEIRLAPSFFGLTDASRYFESQLMVFLHELSHWAAGTRDMHKDSAADRPTMSAEDAEVRCYGASKGAAWACARGKYQNGVMKAVLNADNVAFFVTSFYF